MLFRDIVCFYFHPCHFFSSELIGWSSFRVNWFSVMYYSRENLGFSQDCCCLLKWNHFLEESSVIVLESKMWDPFWMWSFAAQSAVWVPFNFFIECQLYGTGTLSTRFPNQYYLPEKWQVILLAVEMIPLIQCSKRYQEKITRFLASYPCSP